MRLVVCFILLLTIGFVSCEKDSSDPNGGGNGSNTPTEQTVNYKNITFSYNLYGINWVTFIATDNSSYDFVPDKNKDATLKSEAGDIVAYGEQPFRNGSSSSDFRTTGEELFIGKNGNVTYHFVPADDSSYIRTGHGWGNLNMPLDSMIRQINQAANNLEGLSFRFRLE